MNNDNPIKLINENGVAKEYARIPDLWHIAMKVQGMGYEQACEAILEVWHMAHDLKACAEGQGEARIVEATQAWVNPMLQNRIPTVRHGVHDPDAMATSPSESDSDRLGFDNGSQ